MSNSLYWEDALSSSGGQQHDMPVDMHAPAFSVQWGKGKYDDVKADHSSITGRKTVDMRLYPGGPYVPCNVCGRWSDLRATHNLYSDTAICSSCQRTQHADERRRMLEDEPMGSNKRSTDILTDTR